MPELRKDPILGRWVIISRERAKRPSDFRVNAKREAGEEDCPFCPGGQSELHDEEILAFRRPGSNPNTPGWWIRVIQDRYPMLRTERELDKIGEGVYDRMEGVGRSEIIIETPDHGATLATMEPKGIEEILWAWRDRILGLKKDGRLHHILIVKNYKKEAGGHLLHPHSQLIAMPIVPKAIKEELIGARHYYDYKERCIFCDIIREELRHPDARLILRNQHFILMAPFASRFPFETWILPQRHTSSFEDIEGYEISSLASTLNKISLRMAQVLGDPPYNLLLHTAPLTAHNIKDYHWHIEIMPILIKVAGFEWGSGFYINPTPPEEAAQYLREAK